MGHLAPMKDINEIPEGASWNALKALNGEFLRLESFKMYSKILKRHLRNLMEPKFDLPVEIVKLEALDWQKNSKRHFLKDIENSFHQFTHIGLEPHQSFSF